MPTVSWKTGPPPLFQRDGDTVSPYNRDIMAFVDACESLLHDDIMVVNCSRQENLIIQYYIAALGAKFPALL